MTFKLGITVLALIALACGCATAYQANGLGGGYEDTRIDETTYMVSFRGNGYTSQERVETSLLLRCAEITKESGFDYFVLLSEGASERVSTSTTPGRFTSNTTGSSTHGTYRPGTTIRVTRHKSIAKMRMFKGEKPGDDANAYTAAELIKYLGPQLGR